MLVGMENEQRKVIFTEQDILDARRLLAVLDERSKRKAAGRLEGPARIQWPEASDVGGAQASGQHAAEGGQGIDPVAVTSSNGLEMGGCAASSPVETGVLRTNGCAHPNPEDAIGADRAKYTLRRLR